MKFKMRFNCPRCGYKSIRKGDMRKHIYKKKLCKPILQDIDIKDRVADILTSDKDTIIKNQQLEIERLRNKLMKYGNKSTFITSHDKPNLDYLTKESIQECCRNLLNYGICKFIRLIYLNPEHKENHSILCSNIRSGYINVYNGENWIKEHANDFIDNLINYITKCLINLCKQYDTQKTIKCINNYYNKIENRNKYFNPKWIIKDVKVILYNNREMVKDTKKKNQDVVLISNSSSSSSPPSSALLS